jgi:glycyl-tRNA synthetase beta chain
LTIQRAEDHAEALRRASVTADVAARRSLIQERGSELAASVGGRLLIDESLVAEVANLVETPFPCLGSFDAAFLELPREVLVTVMRVHQRYFPIVDAKDQLTNHFLIVAGTKVADPQVVARGNARVIAARFWDGRFLFEIDKAQRLEDMANGLSRMLFIQQLGTVADKVARVNKLADWLCTQLAVSTATRQSVLRTAALCKADLASKMVFEFPELAGVMGSYYARHHGEPDTVARAIAEHYLPRGAEDVLPASLPGAVVGLADRMDSLCGIFGIGEVVTGAKDKFGLRRATLGCLRVLAGFAGIGLAVPLREFIAAGIAIAGDRIRVPAAELAQQIEAFFVERLRNWLGETLPGDVCNAVLARGAADVAATISRARALGELVAADRTDEASAFRALSQAAKRTTNILRQAVDKGVLAAEEIESPGAIEPARLRETVEREFVRAIQATREGNEQCIAAHDYARAFRNLADLKPVLDGFFGADSKSGVMIMVPDDAALRSNRLRILGHFGRLIQGLADMALLNR